MCKFNSHLLKLLKNLLRSKFQQGCLISKLKRLFLVYHVKLRHPCLENGRKIIVRIFVNTSPDVLMSLLHQLLPGLDLINTFLLQFTLMSIKLVCLSLAYPPTLDYSCVLGYHPNLRTEQEQLLNSGSISHCLLRCRF